MTTYRFIVLTNPTTPEQEDEYNKWYDEVHAPGFAGLPGFVSVQRFVWAARSPADKQPEKKYLAIYELETDDPQASFAALAARSSTPDWIMSDALERPPLGMLFEALGDPVLLK